VKLILIPGGEQIVKPLAGVGGRKYGGEFPIHCAADIRFVDMIAYRYQTAKNMNS